MSDLLRFDAFEVDLSAGQVRKRGIRISLRDQPFQVLATLLEHPGEVVTREELRRRLWHDNVFVDFENGLNIAIARLRTVLGDSAEHPRFIETLPRRGYRFIGEVLSPPVASEAEPAKRPRLIVLPFANLNGDPGQDYVSDAVTDEVITELAALAPENLGVIARTTAMRYRGARKDVARIGRELNVDYVVEGGVRREGELLSITVQLIRTGDQTHLFARRYEGELRDGFEMRTRIAEEIAAHLGAPPVAAEVRERLAWAHSRRKPTENLAAYNEYIQGRYEMWKWTPEGAAKAKQHFEAALAHDPGFALACDGLANLFWYLGFWGFLPPDETEPTRMFYALRAIELDPALAEARALLSFHPEKSNYVDPYSYNWAEAAKQMAHARDLNPNSPLLRLRYASVLLVLGRTDEAVAELERALEYDPLSLELHYWLAEVLFFGGQFEQALAEGQKLLELEPEHHLAHMVLGWAFLGMQRYDESIAAFRRAVEISGEFPLMLGWLGLALGLARHKAQARKVLERLHAIARERFVLPTSFAWVHVGLGQVDEAFVWMERAVDRNDGWIHSLRGYPFLDPYRTDPRYAALARKMKLI